MTQHLLSTDLCSRQAVFLNLFGATRGMPDWETSAVKDALGSSLKRNPTYAPVATAGERDAFRQAWRDELLEIAAGYMGGTKPRGDFERDVLVLQATLNHRFGHLLQPVRRGYSAGFRISHSQKSLSLMLKHAWCHGLMEEPPACPVDRLILGVVDAPERMRTWTKVNSMADYLAQLALLEEAAHRDGKTVATWELWNFK